MMGNYWTVGITLTTCSLIFYLFLIIVYFRKNAKYNLRNYLYRRILTFGLASFSFEIVYFLLCRFTQDTILIALTKKFELLTIIACLFLWAYYVILVIFAKNKNTSIWIRKNRASIDLYLLLAFVTISFITLVLPVHFMLNANDFVEYLYGPAFIFDEIIMGILVLIPLPFILENKEIIVHKRLLSYYFQLPLTILFFIAHLIWPALSMNALCFTLCCYMIYTRLENPDILFVRKFKKTSDRLSEIRENYGFLFGMTPELRDLFNEIASMRNDAIMNPKKGINRKKLDSLLTDFLEGKEGKSSKKAKYDSDGIEILDLEEDTSEEMMVTREIYTLNELNEVLKEDNLPKW